MLDCLAQLLQDDHMSERKYRQRGYQDEPRDRAPRDRDGRAEKPAPARAPGRPLQDASGPRTPHLMGAHEVFKCARCGSLLSLDITVASRCSRCGVDVHSCINCVAFDTGARWECTEQARLSARVTPKDAGNLCTLFSPRTTVERQTGTPGPTSARQAFDDLFK